MSATFSTLRTQVARDLRDPNNATWTSTEIGDMVNAGIADVSQLMPKALSNTVASVTQAMTQATVTGATPDWFSPFRVDALDADGAFLYTIPPSLDGGPLGGWEWFGGELYLPPSPFVLPSKVTVWGYCAYAQLSSDSDTTDMPTDGVNLMRAFCRKDAFARLMNDRAMFQQWQTSSNATDTSAIGLAQLYSVAQRDYTTQRARLRTIRRKS